MRVEIGGQWVNLLLYNIVDYRLDMGLINFDLNRIDSIIII